MSSRQPPRRGAARWIPAVALTAVAVTSSLLVLACSPANEDGSPSPSATATAEPGGPTPRPTTWPTGTIGAAKNLGLAHNDFEKLHADVLAALGSEDPARILVAMNDAIAFLEGNQPNIARLQEYEGTRALGDAVAPTYQQMIDGAKQVKSGIETGDGSAVEAGFATFFAGTEAYIAVSGDLVIAAEQAIFMERVLLR